MDRSLRLIETIQRLSFARTLADIQAEIRKEARDLLGADGVTFILRRDNTVCYVDEDAVAPLWKGQSFPVECCISGWAIRHRQPVAIPDIYADARIPTDLYRPTFVKSLMMVPIRMDQPIGAIGAYWARPHAAAAEELHWLQALADSTALALSNIEQRRELEERSRLMQLAHEAMLIRKVDGTILSWNEGARELYGFTEHEALGRISHDLLRTVFPSAVADVERALEQQGVWKGELTHYTKHGRMVIVESRMQLLPTEAGASIVLETNRDMTRRKETERALEQTVAELKDKVAELEAFHDVVVDRELRMMELEKEIERLRRVVEQVNAPERR